MGITYTLIKGIPFKRHLDSFEIKNTKDNSYKELTLDEYLSAYNSYMSELVQPSPNVREIPEAGRRWKGIFTEAKKIVLQGIAFTGEAFVHQRGRYDYLSPEVAREFEERLLQDVTGDDWERVFRFKTDKVNTDEPIGLISILEHPALGCDNSYNAQDIFKRLVQTLVDYKAELITVYGRGEFAKVWPFRETESGLVVADRSQEANGGLGMYQIGTAPNHTAIASNYAKIIPSKENVMFFSFTAYNNEHLGDRKDISKKKTLSK